MQGSFTASFQYQFTHPRTAFFHQQNQITHPHQRQRGRQEQEAKNRPAQRRTHRRIDTLLHPR